MGILIYFKVNFLKDMIWKDLHIFYKNFLQKWKNWKNMLY